MTSVLIAPAAVVVAAIALVYAIYRRSCAERAAKTMAADAKLRKEQWADEHQARVEAEAEASRLAALTTQDQHHRMPPRVAKASQKSARKTKGGK